MNSEAQKIIAFVFKRSGKKQIPYSDFYLTLSMELNWFTPDDAKKFLDFSIEKEILIKKKDMVQPTFDYEVVEVPYGFYPTKFVYEPEVKEVNELSEKKIEEDIFSIILKKIVTVSKKDEKEIINKIRSLEKEKNITQEIAALLVGKEFNISLEEYYKEVEEKIFEKI